MTSRALFKNKRHIFCCWGPTKIQQSNKCVLYQAQHYFMLFLTIECLWMFYRPDFAIALIDLIIVHIFFKEISFRFIIIIYSELTLSALDL